MHAALPVLCPKLNFIVMVMILSKILLFNVMFLNIPGVLCLLYAVAECYSTTDMLVSSCTVIILARICIIGRAGNLIYLKRVKYLFKY